MLNKNVNTVLLWTKQTGGQCAWQSKNRVTNVCQSENRVSGHQYVCQSEDRVSGHKYVCQTEDSGYQYMWTIAWQSQARTNDTCHVFNV